MLFAHPLDVTPREKLFSPCCGTQGKLKTPTTTNDRLCPAAGWTLRYGFPRHFTTLYVYLSSISPNMSQLGERIRKAAVWCTLKALILRRQQKKFDPSGHCAGLHGPALSVLPWCITYTCTGYIKRKVQQDEKRRKNYGPLPTHIRTNETWANTRENARGG